MTSQTSSPQTQAAPIASVMPPIVIIADDLTGACDSAAAFLCKAEAVRVLLDPARAQAGAAIVTAISTETRNQSAVDAAQRVECTRAKFRDIHGTEIIFKKIDSAGRGYLVVETMAALRAWGRTLALVAPAFPDAGRRVSNGVLGIRDSAGQDSSLNLMTMFQEECGDTVDLLPVGEVDELERGIRRALDRGIRVLLCDSETQEDLVRLAGVASRIQQPLLWTGSAGLASALAYQFPPARSTKPIDYSWTEGRTLLFVGTEHPLTALQVSHLQQSVGGVASSIHRVQWNDSSAENVRSAFAESSVSTLILTGGDTAAFVLKALKAHAIRLAGELAPGIPWGFIEGGEAHGCAVVTKSGGFGQHDALTKVFQFCSRRVCAPA